jgi:hypothetical protein
MRRSFFVLASVSLAAPLAGCGSPVSAMGGASATTPTVTMRYPAQGVTFEAPPGWSRRGGSAPLVATVRTGQATVAIWRFQRREPLPETPAQLDGARVAIIKASVQRDPTFEPIKTATTRVAGHPAVQIRARETVAGRRQVVRSTHIFHAGAEVIVDAYADPDSFRGVDAAVFRPLLRSLRLGASPKGA